MQQYDVYTRGVVERLIAQLRERHGDAAVVIVRDTPAEITARLTLPDGDTGLIMWPLTTEKLRAE